MAVDTSRSISLQLYHFMCRNIVGTEETVRTRRLLCTTSDNLRYNDIETVITSGSVGEGLQMKGSDLDTMYVAKQIIVHEDTVNIKINPNKINLIMETHDTKPGFTQLRVVIFDVGLVLALEQRGNSWYMSSEMFKLLFLNVHNNILLFPSKIHGPCLSDLNDLMDDAFCLHSPHWIQAAENWISRGIISWPSRDVKSKIIDHGVLFVPIGCKGSVNESLEWRISFSVAEKLLIYSFSHTQLLCYTLMKILLKDVINSNINCKNLLCSYFIKTIIFWVSEETPVTEWKPDNLIQCFMRCFRRLLYCVEYSMCPHYFIPIINMFENKIEKQSQQLLLEHLNTLFSFGWRCVLFSEQCQTFTIHSNALPSKSDIKSAQFRLSLMSYHFYWKFIMSRIEPELYRKCIRVFNIYKSSVIKLTYMSCMSSMGLKIQESIVTPSDINKKMYSQCRAQLAYLLQHIYHDAVSGWIYLAAFFYKTKQYSNALYILSYAIKKCTPEKVYYDKYGHTRLSQIQLNLTTSTTLQRLGILRVLKLVAVFPVDSLMIPELLALDCAELFPPVAFAHFLCFLCHHHLNDIQQCNNSIRDLLLCIENKYFIKGSIDTGQSYYLFGKALQIVGKTNLAKNAFMRALNSIYKV